MRWQAGESDADTHAHMQMSSRAAQRLEVIPLQEHPQQLAALMIRDDQ